MSAQAALKTDQSMHCSDTLTTNHAVCALELLAVATCTCENEEAIYACLANFTQENQRPSTPGR